MTRLVTISFFCFFILLYACNLPVKENANDSVPADKSVSIPDSVHYHIPVELNFDSNAYHDPDDLFMLHAIPRFYPIGWSKNGYFAYAQIMADTALRSKAQRFEIQIRDLEHDTVLWMMGDVISGSRYADFNANKINMLTIDSIWKTNYDSISKALWKYGIVQTDVNQSNFISLYTKDVLEETSGDKLPTKVVHPDGFDHYTDVEIHLESYSSKKSKLFYKRKFSIGPTRYSNGEYLMTPDRNQFTMLIQLYFHTGRTDLDKFMYDVATVDPTQLKK
jgi:hypothetical protein